jgi:hypothetical protein
MQPKLLSCNNQIYTCLCQSVPITMKFVSYLLHVVDFFIGGRNRRTQRKPPTWQTLSHDVVHLPLIGIQIHNISCDMHWLHKSIRSRPWRPLGLCVLNATLNNLKWRSALLVDDAEKIYNTINQNQTGRWFSLGPQVSSTNKTDHHDITEILLKVAPKTNKCNSNLPWQNLKWRSALLVDDAEKIYNTINQNQTKTSIRSK